MLIVATAALAACALSLLAGFAVRRRLVRPLPLPPAGSTAHGPGTDAGQAPAITAPERWASVAAALLRPDRWPAALAIWLAVLDTALALAGPWPLQAVVDYGIGHQPRPWWLATLGGGPAAVALAAAAAGLLLLAAGAVTGYLGTVLATALEERMAARLRAGLVGHLLRAAPGRAAEFPLGELTSRLSGDTARVAATIVTAVDTLVPEATLLAGMTAVTAVIDWRLTLIAVAVIPLYALTARCRNRGLLTAQREARSAAGDLASLAAGLLARLPVVHVFDRAADEADRYRRVSTQSAAAEVRAVDASARFAPVTDTLPGLALAATLVTGTIEVTSGRLTLGALLVFLAYLSSLTGPVRSLARLSGTVARGTASRDRVAGLLRLPVLEPLPAAAPGAVTGSLLPRPGPSAASATRRVARGPEISLTDVGYAHRPGRPVLDGATLRVPAAACTALTGPSGSGKSTLLSLLVRLADARHGLITIDGEDITRIPLRRLRALVTLVPQDPWLHAGTIAENIGYGRRDSTPGQVRDAAERAGVAAFAEGLPDGYATPVGEHGHQLSGGQQRRVAIARALLRDTPVLLLDEPTAGLDPATEDRMVAGLLAATRGKTVILVTHQPALIARASHVVRLCAGRLTPVDRWPADDGGLRDAPARSSVRTR